MKILDDILSHTVTVCLPISMYPHHYLCFSLPLLLSVIHYVTGLVLSVNLNLCNGYRVLYPFLVMQSDM